MQYTVSFEAAEKIFSAKNFEKKSAHFCKDLADLYGSSSFSATIFAEPCRKNPADLHRFAKIGNLGSVIRKTRLLNSYRFSPRCTKEIKLDKAALITFSDTKNLMHYTVSALNEAYQMLNEQPIEID